ncbi:MAG TPA: hypothetical protein VFS64_01100 [Solirubrobacterales bacterium]|nr:hypothetical protein [Solirubrobacterales bacterium]
MSAVSAGSALENFAKSRGLSYAERADLPPAGEHPGHSDAKLEGTAKGALPGGIEGTLANFTYTFKPDRVMSGPLPAGGEGALVLCATAASARDRIAVVLGPKGPVAEAGLEAEAPGLSTKDLDTFLEQLAGEASEDKATAPA